MPGLPGFYLTDPSGLIILPAYESYGAPAVGVEELAVRHRTDAGNRFVYPQFSSEIREMKFLFWLDAQRQEFREWHDLVVGDAIPHYFVPDTNNMSDFIYGHKDANFLPRELDNEWALVNGVVVPIYEYTVRFTGAPLPGTF